MTVGELLSRITSGELSEWVAYEKVSGTLGAERDDMHAAIVASTVVNANKGKGRKATVKDFMPRWDRQPMGWQEQLAAIKQWNRALGGIDRTGGR